MKVFNLTKQSEIYTSNVYYILGSKNALEDKNTLIDVGRDPAILDVIQNFNSGVGKHKVDQVILTHEHYDHSSLLPEIKKRFNPKVYAFSPFVKGIDQLIKDGDILKAGDEKIEIIHTPGHTNDSICIYCPYSRSIFVGDTPIIITNPSSYEPPFINAYRKLISKKIQTVYPGHGPPLTENINEKILKSFENIYS